MRRAVTRPPHSRRLHDLLAIALLLVIGTALFGDILFAGRQLYLRDLTRYYYPTKQIVREVILGGNFPFWNPDYSAGQPMAANPEYEVFYPLQWLILLPSYNIGYQLHIVAHVWVALVGMYLFLRSMKLRIPASLFGALTFGIGGLYMSMVNLLPILFCAAWMPLILMFARRFMLRPTARDYALTALFLGMQMLTAEPTTLIQTWFLIGTYALYRAWYSTARVRGVIRYGIYTAAMIAGGGLVGAAQFFPAIDHVHDSVRSRVFDFGLVSCWSMPFAKPLELIFPSILGHMAKNNVTWYWGGGIYPNVGSPFLFNYYIGLLAVALIVGGILARPRGSRMVLWISCVSTILALGSHTPLLGWMYDTGIAKSIRYPEKFALLGLFALIIWASHLFDRMLRGDKRIAAGAIGFLLATTVFAGLVVASGFTPLYQTVWGTIFGVGKSPNLKIILEISRLDWAIALVRGTLLLLLFSAIRHTSPRRWWYAAVLVFVVADLAPIAREVNPSMPASFASPPPVVATLDKNTKDYRIFHEADWYGQSVEARTYFSTGASVYWVVRNGLFPMTTADWHYRTVLERDYDKTALLPTVDLVESMWKVRDGGQKQWADIFMAMSNARYRSEYRPFKEEKKRVGNRMNDLWPMDFHEGTKYPRYYFTDQMATIRDKTDFVEKLTHQRWSRKVAFVQGSAFQPANGKVVSLKETPNTIDLDVTAEGRSFLVLSVTPHKYWRATIDGVTAEPRIVNIGYQGLEVPAGRHRIRFAYRNDIVVLCVTISVVSFLLFLAIALCAGRRARPHRELAAASTTIAVS